MCFLQATIVFWFTKPLQATLVLIVGLAQVGRVILTCLTAARLIPRLTAGPITAGFGRERLWEDASKGGSLAATQRVKPFQSPALKCFSDTQAAVMSARSKNQSGEVDLLCSFTIVPNDWGWGAAVVLTHPLAREAHVYCFFQTIHHYSLRKMSALACFACLLALDRWGLFTHAAVKHHQSTRWPLPASRRIVICMQNSTLEQKKSPSEDARSETEKETQTWRKAAINARCAHFLFISKRNIQREPQLMTPHRGRADKHNIDFPPTYCKSNTQSKLCFQPALIYSCSRSKVIYHKCNKSTDTANWFPLQ